MCSMCQCCLPMWYIELSHTSYEQPSFHTLPLERELAAKCGAAAFPLPVHFVLLEFLFTLMWKQHESTLIACPVSCSKEARGHIQALLISPHTETKPEAPCSLSKSPWSYCFMRLCYYKWSDNKHRCTPLKNAGSAVYGWKVGCSASRLSGNSQTLSGIVF